MTLAIEHLLTSRTGWKVIRISSEWDDGPPAQELKWINPDVLIVSEGIIASHGQQLIRIVQDFPKLKIITISLGNNQMEIYDKQTICIKEASDLLSVIAQPAYEIKRKELKR